VVLYYVDGYHGGVKGHMPLGAWRDILQTLRRTPDWKLALDIEPVSWAVLRRSDPASYAELREYLADQTVDARLEIVAASYAQPFAWAIGGESNIRHLIRGREIVREHFPDLCVDTYAVQEPCWTSALPQILRSLGYTRAVLRDASTAWAGYPTGVDAAIVNWVGPDGSAIPCVPRYACEALVKCWETESCAASEAFARKCLEHGITKPSGMGFQDLGWAARPKVQGEYIRYVTWREYFERIAGTPSERWQASQEDLVRCTLPWGERTLQRLARQVRSAEVSMLVAEKMAALAHAWCGRPAPQERLQAAWDDVLMAQHHDAWICATQRQDRDNWAWQVGAETWAAEETCREIIAGAAEALAVPGLPIRGTGGTGQRVCVFNTLAGPRDDLAEIKVATEAGTGGFLVRDLSGQPVQAQVVTTRTYAEDHTLNAGTVLFRATTPGLGYAVYDLSSVPEPPAAMLGPRVSAYRADDGTVILDSDLYHIVLDPARGGAVTSLLVRALGRDFCDGTGERLFNEYTGYFIADGAWYRSSQAPAQVTILEAGPVRATVALEGTVGPHPFRTLLSVVQGQARIDCTVRFSFAAETWVGDPWDIAPQDRRLERRRSQHDDRWKLHVVFPTTWRQQVLDKGAAYDVCRSSEEDTFFQRWDEIKHNIILDWVDVLDEETGCGLALLSDHTTSYLHGPDYPLGLVLGWGWEGGYWWGKCPLLGSQMVNYALLPHAGTWEEANLPAEYARWREPLLSQLGMGDADGERGRRSFLQIDEPSIQAPALYVQGSDVLVRLYNAAPHATECTVTLGATPTRVELVELDGRLINVVHTAPQPDGRCLVRLTLRPFGLQTLRLSGPGGMVDHAARAGAE
jgi:alpha-mannosidase